MLNFHPRQGWTIRQAKAQPQADLSDFITVEEFQKSYEIRKFISASMKPTLDVNDRVFVNKLAYRETQPKRGDIVLYTLPASQGGKISLTEDLDNIHRVIGLPGETISIAGGLVMINNRVLIEDYLLDSTDYTLEPTVIPENSYFILGDNRNASADSHFWGSVSNDQLIGQVVGVFCPPEHQKLLISQDVLTPEIEELWTSGTDFFQRFYESSQSCAPESSR